MKIQHQAPLVAVAGHICLDIIPTFHSASREFKDILIPGKLIDVGPASMATGGSVSNTGIALHRLGRVGEDPIQLVARANKNGNVGTGETQLFPDPAAFTALMDLGVGFEVMDNAAACRTYNILMSEGRGVVAGLIL